MALKDNYVHLPRVLAYLRPYKRLAAAGVTLIVASGLIGLLLPWPLQLLIDNVLGHHALPKVLSFLPNDKYTLLLILVLGGLVLTLLENTLHVLTNYVNTNLEQKMVLDFRSDLFSHALRLSLAFHDRRRTGGLIYAINQQADAAAGLVMTIPPLATSLLTLVGMFAILMSIDWKIALLSLSVVPFLYYSVGYYATHIQDRLSQVKQMEGESLSIVHEAIGMLRVIVAFGREDHEHARFRSQGARAIAGRVKVTLRQTLFSLAVNMITATGTALVLGLGAHHVISGKLTVGQLLVVMAYLASVYKPLEVISYTIGSQQERFVNLKMAFGLLDQVPEIQDAPDAITMQTTRGRITFDHLNFSYTGRVNTLTDINLDIGQGQVIAIVGHTGAGKSTLVNLIPRFYAAKSGRILLDGIDITKITQKSLRAQIAIVPQEALLFSGTIADNIRYGRLGATMGDVITAAKAANAHDFIMGLPKKYETELGERGSQLSGGERQRIAIARAFVKDAPILILDEPTSSVDYKTEAVILEALERLMHGRTTILIAHRLSTIRRADLICVMEKGKIIERGTHDELLAKHGVYAQLCAIQTGQNAKQSQPVATVI